MTAQAFKKIFKFFLVGWLFLGGAGLVPAAPGAAPEGNVSANELTLEKALRAAEGINPGIKVSLSMEKKAEASASIISSFDYPNIDLSLAKSFGLSADFYPAPLVFDGLLNAPYRTGAGAQLLGRWDLIDISRWNDLDQHHHEIKSAEENTRIKRLELYQQALQYYFEASLMRGQREVWADIVEKAQEILKVAKTFVRTGEYNEDKMRVIRVELQEAETERDTFDEKYRKTLEKLALITGLDEKDMECPLPSAMDEGILKVIQDGSLSPYLTFAQSEIKAAQSGYAKAGAEHLPKLFVMGSVGALEGERFAPQDDYAVWVGLTVPVFEGFRIVSEEREARALIQENEERMEDAQLDVDELNVQYDEKISVSRLRLPLLEQQHADAVHSYKVGRERFLSYRETVVVMREALRDLSETGTKLNESKIELLTALGFKSFLNGGVVPK